MLLHGYLLCISMISMEHRGRREKAWQTIICHHVRTREEPGGMLFCFKRENVTDLTQYIRVPASHLENSAWQSAPGNVYLKRRESTWHPSSISRTTLSALGSDRRGCVSLDCILQSGDLTGF